MATYSAVSASEKDADSPITVGLIDKLDQNPLAIAEGASGAPQIQSAAIATNAVTQSTIASGAVHQSELDTSIGTVSSNGITSTYVLPGGTYGFYPQVKTPSAFYDSHAQIAYNYGTSNVWATVIRLDPQGDTDMDARQRYINSSPPIDLGDGNIPLFFFAEVKSSGEIISTYSADVPPWLYNGPTNAAPTEVRKVGRDNRLVKMQRRTRIDPRTKRATVEEIEVNNDLKNADMDLIPHPFVSAGNDSTIVLLDPVATEELLLLHNAGEEIGDLFRDEYLRLDNERLNRACPNGVMPVSFRWRDTMSR